jgi:hypothetical protein
MIAILRTLPCTVRAAKRALEMEKSSTHQRVTGFSEYALSDELPMFIWVEYSLLSGRRKVAV